MKLTGDQENIGVRDLVINGKSIETVNNFISLGANFTDDCNDSKEVRRRLAIARNAGISLTNVWKDRCLALKTKIRVLNTLGFHSSNVWLLAVRSCLLAGLSRAGLR